MFALVPRSASSTQVVSDQALSCHCLPGVLAKRWNMPELASTTKVPNIAAEPVMVRTAKGDFVGVIGSKAPHILKPEERKKVLDIADMYIDVGATEGFDVKKKLGVKPGDQIILRPKPVGTLVHDALLPGKRLWFFATGTGIAPFASLLREQGFELELASVAHYPDHEQALRDAGVHAVFNFYASAGESFAEHVEQEFGSLITVDETEVVWLDGSVRQTLYPS